MKILEIHQGKSKVYMNNIPATKLEKYNSVGSRTP